MLAGKTIINMLQTLKLLLPALIPSWRFFDTIAPSPRIEFALLRTMDDAPCKWQEFRPLPAFLTITEILKRLFWNPRWNESLFLVSCAERLMQNPTDHSSKEIISRIKAECHRTSMDVTATPYFQFRLVFLTRHGNRIRKHVTYISTPNAVSVNESI